MTRRAVFHDTGDDSYDDGAGALTDFPSTSGGPPSGSAGGDLTGTYPNPTLGTGAFGTPAVVLGTAAAAGSSSDAVRTDATIVAFDATVPSTQAFGDAAAAGSAAVAARRDHKHAMPANPFTGASAGGDLTGTYPNPTLGTSGVTAATYGDATHVAQVAVDAKGRITSASAVAISGVSGGTVKLYDFAISGSDQASIDTAVDGTTVANFAGYDILELWMLARTDEAAAAVNFSMILNNDTSALYDQEYSDANNTTLAAANGAAQTAWTRLLAHGSGGSASYPSIGRMSIPGYAATTFFKVAEYKAGSLDATAGNAFARSEAMGYRSTSAITRVKIAAAGAAKLKVGSRLIIFGR